MDLKIFTDNIEGKALDQVYTLCKQEAFKDCKVRIMPDVHAGAGCVIGFTADMGDKVIPNIVGVDIGCGMLTVELGKIDIDLEKLDEVIRLNVPVGHAIRTNSTGDMLVEGTLVPNLRCFKHLKDVERIYKSVGTLGGGNHFIEVDEGEDDKKYLVIHTGSRNLGKQVAEYYQKGAIDTMLGKDDLVKEQEELIQRLKAEGRAKDIQKELSKLKSTQRCKKLNIPSELCYLTGQNRLDYLHDMNICQEYAHVNRATIARAILSKMGIKFIDGFETVHNYINFEDGICRKGAISAQKGEKVLIPLNMRDGCIIGIGRGNEDWNCSAPHGAGRVMSRSVAKENISMEDYVDSMQGIYTTSVSQSTIDESPMAYKPMQEIIDNIKDTVDVQEIIKPIYNFKAGE